MNAILTIKAGSEDSESCDLAASLLRAYARWMERDGHRFEVVFMLHSDFGGIKRAAIVAAFDSAYEVLKGERGIHRFARFSPFEATKEIRRSFCSVGVLPEVAEEIPDSEIAFDVERPNGFSGWERTKPIVRARHRLTGIEAFCDASMSSVKNKRAAKATLASAVRNRDLPPAGDVRAYVFAPVPGVKDLRTGRECPNVAAVMDGDIGQFLAPLTDAASF